MTHLRYGSADAGGSAPSSAEARKSAHYACHGQVSFDDCTEEVEGCRMTLGARREARQNPTTSVPSNDRGANSGSCATLSPDWGWALEVLWGCHLSFLVIYSS